MIELPRQNGERVVMPMCYHCLPAGKPESFDRRFPGTFNARRDSLGDFWRGVFGVTHGVAIVSAFCNSRRLYERGRY